MYTILTHTLITKVFLENMECKKGWRQPGGQRQPCQQRRDRWASGWLGGASHPSGCVGAEGGVLHRQRALGDVHRAAGDGVVVQVNHPDGGDGDDAARIVENARIVFFMFVLYPPSPSN